MAENENIGRLGDCNLLGVFQVRYDLRPEPRLLQDQSTSFQQIKVIAIDKNWAGLKHRQQPNRA